MTAFKLPEGYTFETAAAEGPAILSDIPQMQEYGGATITEKWDAQGVHFVALCCKNPAGLFRFRIFREDAPEAWREVPLPHDCDGRGSITKNDYDGTLRWRAWKGNQFFGDIVPEAVAFGAGKSEADIPPEAPTDLNDKDYASLDEMFGVPGFRERFNKQLRALIQLRRLARARGWLS